MGQLQNKLIFDEIVMEDGEEIEQCLYDDDAMGIPGFLPVRDSQNGNTTIYLNVDKIREIHVRDDRQKGLYFKMIAPPKIVRVKEAN